MKKIMRLVLILAITFLLVNIFNNNVYADGNGGLISVNDYNPGEVSSTSTTQLVEKVGIILGAVRDIAAVVSVITLMIIGFKYIIGSVEEKANYKQTLVPYVIGAILAVGGTSIVSFIYNSIH